jgi:ribose/xylose/arabinose/galactoside ABC-type transport system permease subunit
MTRVALEAGPKTGKFTVKPRNLLNYELILTALILLVVVVLSIGSHGAFWLKANLIGVFVDVSTVGIAAIGMTLVILTGGIDVSIGSVLGLVAAVVALTDMHGFPLFLIILAALATGAIAGLLNGYFIALQKIPPIIVTLGTMSIWRAAVFMLMGGNWNNSIPGQLTAWFVMNKPLGLPVSLWLEIILVVVAAFVMRKRKWGRYIYALGNNEDAAIVAGLPIKRLKVFIYMMTGVLTAVAALVSLGQTPLVQASTGTGFELTVIAAVVIGGTSIIGGQGSVIGGFLGAILVELVQDGVVLFHIQPFWQGVAMCVMILVAVLMGLSRRKGGER